MEASANSWEMIGHKWAVDLLHGQLAGGEISHAYLITGPQGTGRRTLALRFAQALNCEAPPAPGIPCRECRTCRQIERLQHPDLSVIAILEDKTRIVIDQVRELQHHLALAPYAARYRIGLFLNLEQANEQAMNALLKTLEEPPPSVILLATAESAELLLPTIVSRCEVLRLRPLSVDTVASALESRWKMQVDQAKLLAHLSNGRLGYALRLHENPDRLEKRQAWMDDHIRLLNSSRVERFLYADEITRGWSKDKLTLRELLKDWLSYWRDVLICATGARVPMANIDRLDEIQVLAAGVSLDSARKMVSSLERTLEILERYVNPRLAMEVLMLELPQTSG